MSGPAGAAWVDALVLSPLAFVAGLAVGFWVGGRYTIRKHRDEEA